MPYNFFIVLNLIDSYVALKTPKKAIQLMHKWHHTYFTKWIAMKNADVRAIAQGYYLFISKIYKYRSLKRRMVDEVRNYCDIAMAIHPTSLRWKEESLCDSDVDKKKRKKRKKKRKRRRRKGKHHNKVKDQQDNNVQQQQQSEL